MRGANWANRAAWCWAGVWLLAALVFRLPLVGRIEAILDHDQSVVGLMALDIAAGRRFPCFFDGQRYMGAIEAYVAAGFVWFLGHEPRIVALSPWVFNGLFVAGQFAVWNAWKGRTIGHLAAGLSLFGSPMLVLWTLVPRGGYVAFLAWALPAMALYRTVTRPGARPLGPWEHVACGFVLALGYLINPLSLTVYAALAVDWCLFRHGVDIRRERNLRLDWIPAGFAPWLWLASTLALIALLAVFCHVDPRSTSGGPYVALAGFATGPAALAVGALGIVVVLAAAGWWTGGAVRFFECLTRSPWCLAGILLALSPFLVNAALVRAGLREDAPSLPVWITAPWNARPNVESAARALGGLLGDDTASAYRSVLLGQGVDPPKPTCPYATAALRLLSPAVVAITIGLVALATWRARAPWSRVLRLEGAEPSDPVVLAGLYLVVSMLLYLLQGTSPNGSSVRYLVPVWVVLPGLLAVGLTALPARLGLTVGLILGAGWLGAQVAIHGDLNRDHEARALARRLRDEKVPAIVAPTPVALLVANLTHGAVGAAEYQPTWPRLSRRYLDRFETGHDVVCVTDRRFPWPLDGEIAWVPDKDFGRHVRQLAARWPDRCRRERTLGPYEIWRIRLPLAAILASEEDHAAPPG